MEIETIEKQHADRQLKSHSGSEPVAYQLELHRAIENLAFLKAEQDGFKRPPFDYWIDAEKEIHRYF
jgi:hypothetical protein